MKAKKLKDFTSVFFSVAMCLLIVACHPVKKISPAAARQSLLDWNLKTTAEAYQIHGSTDTNWDAAATNALVEFARYRSREVPPDEDAALIIRTNCQAAVRAGCDDPLVGYLYIKYAMDQTNNKEAFADAFLKVADEMKKSGYPPIRKFYAAARAMDQLYYTYGNAPSVQADRGGLWLTVNENLSLVLADKQVPAREAAEAAELTFTLIGGPADLAQLYHNIEKPLFANWPDDSTSWRFKGTAYVKMAWAARGGGYADKVSADGWKTFGDDLGIAEAALQKAWLLDTNDEIVPIQMLRVAEGEQKSRAEMELWFNRALAIDPNCYEACHDKLHYLYPQWYGSRDAMVEFGRECVANTNWGGRVPLILVDAHAEYWRYMEDGEEKSNYWNLPDVWPDIKAAYARYLEANPNVGGFYASYAWYAYKCGQWESFLQLVPKLGSGDYDNFGGKEALDEMVVNARKLSGRTD